MEMVQRFDWRRNWFLLALILGVVLLPLSGPIDQGVLRLLRPISILALFFGIVGLATLLAAIYIGPVAERSRRNLRLLQGLGALLIFAAFLAAPAYADNIPYVTTYKLTVALQWVMVVVGINLLTGYTGQISLGQGAYFAIGGYFLAIASFHEWSLPWGLSLILAPILTGLLGFLFGFPALRFKGPYLALATLALAVVISPVAKRFEDFTGGVQGIPMYGKFNTWGIFGDDYERFLYYFSLVAAAVMLLLVWNIMHSRLGRALIAIRDNEVAAAAMGVNTALYKTTAFGIAAAFAGFAGAINAATIQFVSPDQYSVLVSIRVFVGAVIGGVASVLGAVVGGLFTQFIPDIAAGISDAAPDAIQAVILVVFMYAMRGGFAGFVEQTWRYGRQGVQLLRPERAAEEREARAAAPVTSSQEQA